MFDVKRCFCSKEVFIVKRYCSIEVNLLHNWPYRKSKDVPFYGGCGAIEVLFSEVWLHIIWGRSIMVWNVFFSFFPIFSYCLSGCPWSEVRSEGVSHDRRKGLQECKVFSCLEADSNTKLFFLLLIYIRFHVYQMIHGYGHIYTSLYIIHINTLHRDKWIPRVIYPTCSTRPSMYYNTHKNKLFAPFVSLTCWERHV